MEIHRHQVSHGNSEFGRLLQQSHWVECQPGFCQWIVEGQNVCFMDLAKMIIEVCVCACVCFVGCWLAASFIVPVLQTEEAFGSLKTYTNTKSLVCIYPEVKTKRFRQRKEEKRILTSSAPPPPSLFSLHPTFPPDLQMNGTLCADIVSRLPNEGGLIMSCVIFCAAGGCEWGEGGREKGGIWRQQWLRDGLNNVDANKLRGRNSRVRKPSL